MNLLKNEMKEKSLLIFHSNTILFYVFLSEVYETFEA